MNDQQEVVSEAAAWSAAAEEILELGAVSALTFGMPGPEIETPATLNIEP